jgi:hypothetical protein
MPTMESNQKTQRPFPLPKGFCVGTKTSPPSDVVRAFSQTARLVLSIIQGPYKYIRQILNKTLLYIIE